MTQKEMQMLLNIPDRTLRDWKKGNREKLYQLLEQLDYHKAQELLDTQSYSKLRELVENEKYFSSLREFEKRLYHILVSGINSSIWLKFTKDTSLSKEARARSAYLYSFLTDNLVKLSFSKKVDVGFFHNNKTTTGNGLAKLYGLKNGIDMSRFNQFKATGKF